MLDSRRHRTTAWLVTFLALVGLSLVYPPAQAADAKTNANASGPVMYPSGVGADLGAIPTTLGLRPTAGPDPDGLQTGVLQGKNYWKSNVAADTRYFEFDIDQEYIGSVGTDDLIASVSYFDGENGAIVLSYNENAEKQIPLANSGQWKTATFALDNFAPATAKMSDSEGPDLRLSSEVDFLISSVRIGTVGAQVTLGANPDSAGISARAGDQSTGLVTGVQDGRPYWQTNRNAPAPGVLYFYMNVSDTFLYDNKNVALVSIDYFDEGSGQFGLHYDSPGDEISDKFKNSEVVSYGDSKTWKTHTFALDDAVLTNRSNGSDFRVHPADSTVELKVAGVRVAVVAATLDKTEGLDRLIDEAARVLRSAREGDRHGQYPVGAKANLSAAIDSAKKLVGDPDVTEVEIKSELHALFDTLQGFRATVINKNLAVGATASASSDAADHPAQHAVDNDQGTFWSSDSAGGWLQADLGSARKVNEARVVWGPAYSPDYEVQVSADGTTYDTVGRSGATGPNGTIRTRFPVKEARYVRVRAGGNEPISIRELELFQQRVIEPRSRLVHTKFPTGDFVVADFSALDYGADPTGVKDATRPIQQAIYDCLDAGGGTVWLPAGRYRVTGTLEVHSFCTVRGDRRDPDQADGDYGTVVIADLPAGDDGPVLFRIGGSAGVMGVTTYYPRQDAGRPIPYNHTFEIPGGAWLGPENYMMSTISDVTMLNSYRGIGISTMPSDGGLAPSSGQVHESATIRNVKGTALLEGVRAYNGADVGTWENVTFDNSYWSSAPSRYRPPARAALDTWTRAHGTGFALGDLEWEQLARIRASDYRVGIHIVRGQRISFAGSFVDPVIRRTDIALQVDDFDSRWGLVVAGGVLEGSSHAIRNDSAGFVKVTGTRVTGATTGTVHRMSGEPPAYSPATLPKPTRPVLYPATAPHGVGYLPAVDATPAIQRALDRAGRDGGGIVYLPAGWYRVSGHLTVRAGVELRGASAVPNRDQLGASGGTVLFAYEGRGSASGTSLVTLNGSRAGARGLRVYYPENNPASAGGLVPYPYAIKASGPATYVVNIGLPNAWNGLDFSDPRNDRFVVRKVTGAFFDHAVTVGANDNGRIEGLLSNGNAVTRLGFGTPNWMAEGNIFPLVIDKYMRTQSGLVTVDGARRLTVANAFAYGFHNGLVVSSGDVKAFNLGTDNLGGDGFTVLARGGAVQVVNLLRYNGTTSSGSARLFNIMAISMQQSSVRVVAAPSTGGTVNLSGNETEPGRYEKGSQVTASATAKAGYAFVNWTLDGTEISKQPSITVTVDADKTLTANFTA